MSNARFFWSRHVIFLHRLRTNITDAARQDDIIDMLRHPQAMELLLHCWDIEVQAKHGKVTQASYKVCVALKNIITQSVNLTHETISALKSLAYIMGKYKPQSADVLVTKERAMEILQGYLCIEDFVRLQESVTEYFNMHALWQIENERYELTKTMATAAILNCDYRNLASTILNLLKDEHMSDFVSLPSFVIEKIINEINALSDEDISQNLIVLLKSTADYFYKRKEFGENEMRIARR